MLDSKIETFLAVVEQGSYTAAAEALHLTQPAVTQQIHRLEAHYGCQLVDSSRRAIRLTEAGQLLYHHLSLQRANERRFSRLLQNTVEPLRVGATLSIADYYLPGPLVGRLLADEQRVRVQMGNTALLLEALHRGELDCAFIEGLFDSALLETRIFCQAEFIAVGAADHPLAGRRVSMAELHPYPLALREPHSGTREILETWLRQHDDSPRSFSQVVELGSFVLIKELVRRSQAVTFVYEAVAGAELAQGNFCRLAVEGFPVAHPLRFAFRRGDPDRRRLVEFFEALGGAAGEER